MGVNLEFKVKVRKDNVAKQRERKYRQEASRLVSMANKRLKRLEQQDLTMSPAYKKFIDEGGQKFGIKGKSAQEVRVEVARLNNFLKQTTSTVRGTKKYLNNIANQIGITKFDSYQSLNMQLRSFFEVSERVREYLKNSKEVSVSIDYKKIWEEVTEYAETIGKEFTSMNEDVVKIAENILQASTWDRIDEITDEFMKNFIDL